MPKSDIQPDLYLFDIEMPELDGLAAAAELTKQGLRRPVVVVTGVEDPALVDRAIASGVSAYLTKPINDLELDAAIKLAASRHAEFTALEAEVLIERRARLSCTTRKLVERAKGLLMTALKLSEQDAFRRLQVTARERNLVFGRGRGDASSTRVCSNRSNARRLQRRTSPRTNATGSPRR